MQKFFFLIAAFSLFAFAQALSAGELMPAPPAPPAPAPLTGTSLPEEPKLTGQEYLDRADSGFDAGRYRDSVADYNSALPLLADNEKLVHAHVRLASAYEALGMTDKVYPELMEALKKDENLNIDQGSVSPRVYDAFMKAKEEVMRQGTIICNCEPSGADVYLGDTFLGEAPVRKERVPAGEYVITLKKPGYETTVDKVTIKKGVTLTVEEKLAEARGEIDVVTDPPGVTVLLDGREAGVTPVAIRRVNAGSHKVELRREYLEPYQETVTLAEGGKKTISAELPMRLLFIGMTEGGGEGGRAKLMSVVGKIMTGMPGLKVLPAGLTEMKAGLKERGLEESALHFIREHKSVLDLEDLAVLSGIMEKTGVRLTLMASLAADGPKKRLTLTLFSGSYNAGDRVVFESDELAGLKDKFDQFLSRWAEQEKGTSPDIGVRLVDRASGAPEVIRVLPGYPAAGAGITTGDSVIEVDGAAVGSKAEFDKLITPGARHKLILANGSRKREVELTAANAPVETPTDSGDYLYNLAMAEYKDILDYTPDAPSTRGLKSLAALDLANAYVRMGDMDKAVKLYASVDTGATSGVCTGTALYRLGQAYERLGLWTEAADSYRKALMLYPDATLYGPEGPYVGPLASERLKELYAQGLTPERWWQ